MRCSSAVAAYLLAAVTATAAIAESTSPAPNYAKPRSDDTIESLDSIEDYGSLPNVFGLSVSPSGNKFSYITHTDKGDYFVVVERGKGIVFSANASNVKGWNTLFPSEKHAILLASDTNRSAYVIGKWENSAAISVTVETGKLVTLLSGSPDLHPAQTGLGEIVGRLHDTDFVFMPAFIKERGYSTTYGLMKADLNTGRATTVARGTDDAIDYFVNSHGVIIAREEFDEVADEHRIFAGANGDLTKIYQKNAVLPELSVVGVLADGTGLLVAGEKGHDAFASVRTLGFDGRLSEPMFEKPGAEIARVLTDIQRVVIGVEYSGMYPSYRFFDETLTRDMAGLASLFPDDAVRYIGAADDGKMLAVEIAGGSVTPSYFLFDRTTRGLAKLGQQYKTIVDADINPVTPIEYKARDGRTIPSVLTYPRGKTLGDKLPLIVMPHGGPAAYDAVGFDWMAQYFASRGYLVFQPNFRGSDGFGREHREAGYGEWGRKMQDDVTDGAELLIRKGWADPNRTCIIGGSYGGYAALAGGAYTPDLYKCVAAIAPVSDLNFMLSETRREAGSASAEYTWWTKLIGSQKDDKAKIEAISPVNAAANFKAPVLLIHGNDDTVVPFEHSARMESALKKAGKPVTLVKLQDGDHWLSKSDVRLQTLRELDKFVTATIGSKQ